MGRKPSQENLEAEIVSTVKKKKEDKVRVWIPTGSTLLDLVCGAGRGMGHEAKGIVNLCANSQGGKTLVCNEAIANAYHIYKDKCKWVYDDIEGGNTFDSMALYGIEIVPEDKDKRVRSVTIQDLHVNIMNFLRSLKEDEFGIYVVDSLDAITSDEIVDLAEGRIEAANKGKEFDKGSYQQEKAKFLSNTFFPQVAAEAGERNCLVILISQLRDNVGGGLYAPKDKVSGGGRSALFYYDTRLWLTKKCDIEANDRQIGVVIHATTKKARGPKPYRECLFPVYFEYGIDNTGANLDYLYDLRTPERGELKKKAASEIEWDGEIHSRSELITYIESNKLRKELARRVIEKWNAEEAKAQSEISSRASRWEEE